MEMPVSDPGIAPLSSLDTTMTQPVIVDLGRERARQIRELKRGEGELWEDVLDVIDEVKDMLGAEAEGKTLVPIILLVEKKTRRQRIEKLLFPLANWDDDDDDDEDDED
jgi:hypothetical protein